MSLSKEPIVSINEVTKDYHLGKVVVPEFAANLTWGGKDWRTLFITASTGLYTLPLKVGPRREPYMDPA